MPIQSSIVFITSILIYKVVAIIIVVDKGILPLEKNTIGITLFVDVTNEDRRTKCDIITLCKKCCLVDENKGDCDIITAYGESFEIVKPRDKKTFLYVAPVIQKHDFVGFCDIELNYNCNKTKDKINVTIPFDTRIGIKSSKALMERYVSGRKIAFCDKLDEDSLNNCNPIDCELKYLDKRPIFDHHFHKCTKSPICLTNPDKEMPDYVYVPNSNTCRNLELPLTVQDIYAISSGLGTVSSSPVTTFDTKVEVMSDSATISQNLILLRDLMYGKLCPMAKEIVLDYSECFKSILTTIALCLISICSCVFILVCCLNTIVWLYIQWSEGKLRAIWKNVKESISKRKHRRGKREKVDSTIRNALLREVIVKDIPIELRNSVIDVCERMSRDVGKKRRYRKVDIGSQISLQEERVKQTPSITPSVSSSTSLEYSNEK